jgi:hypothetical protein
MENKWRTSSQYFVLTLVSFRGKNARARVRPPPPPPAQMAACHSKSWMPIGNLLDDSVTGVARAVGGELVVITENNSVGCGFAQVPRGHSLSSTHMPLCGMHEVLGEEVCGYCYIWSARMCRE